MNALAGIATFALCSAINYGMKLYFSGKYPGIPMDKPFFQGELIAIPFAIFAAIVF